MTTAEMIIQAQTTAWAFAQNGRNFQVVADQMLAARRKAKARNYRLYARDCQIKAASYAKDARLLMGLEG